MAFGAIAALGGPPARAQIAAEAFIPGPGTQDLSFVNTATNTVSPILPLLGPAFPPVGQELIPPTAVAASPDGATVFFVIPEADGPATSNATPVVGAVDVASQTQAKLIPLPASTSGAAALAPSPDDKTLFVADTGSNDVLVVNTATGVTTTIPVGARPVAVAVAPNGTQVFAVNHDDSTVSVINTAIDTVVATVPVGAQPVAAVVTPNGSSVYVINQGDGTITQISTATNAVTATIDLTGTTNPALQLSGVAITPDGSRLYVVSPGTSSVFVINTATNQAFGAPIALPSQIVSGFLSGAAITPDGKLLFVVAGVSSNPTPQTDITVISTASDTVVGSFSTPQDLLDPQSNGVISFPTLENFIGPNLIVPAGGPLRIGSDADLTTLGFGSFVDFNGGTLQLAGTLVTTRTFSLLSTGGTIDTNGFDGVLGGTIIGVGALTKIGAGTLFIDGAAMQTGGTTIAGGTLAVGDALHPGATLAGNVSVLPGGTLAGFGSVGGVVTNQGTVAPGGSVGTLTVGGYVGGPGGTLAIEVTPGVASLLRVTGAAKLGGTAVAVTADPGTYALGTIYPILTAAGGVSGSLGPVSASAPAGFLFEPQIGPNQVYLELLFDFTKVNGGVLSPNESAVAAALNTAESSNGPAGVAAAFNLIAPLSPAAQADALDQLGGEIYADTITQARASGRDFRAAMGDELVGGGGPQQNAQAARTQLAGLTPVGSADSFWAWARSYGTFQNIDASAGNFGVSGSSGGGALGIERVYGADLTLGVALGYSHGSFDLIGLPQSSTFNNYAIGAYGETRWESWFLGGSASFAYQQGDAHRDVVAAGGTSAARGSFDGGEAGLTLGLGYRWHMDSIQIEPQFGIDYSHVTEGSFTETGSTAPLAVAGSDADALRTTLGARLADSYAMSFGTVTPEARVGWEHEVLSVQPIRSESFAGVAGSSFSLSGASPGRDAALLGAGVSLAARPDLALYARYEATLATHATDHAVLAGITATW